MKQMKRIIAVLCAVTVSVSVMLPLSKNKTVSAESVQEFTYDQKSIVQDFSGYNTDNIWCWGGGIESSMISASGDKITVSYPAGEDATFSLPINTPNNETAAVSFDIDASAVSEVFCLRVLYSIDPDYISTAQNKDYYLIDESGSSKLTIGADGNMDIPAGFKGTVTVPMESFGITGSNWTAETIYEKENLRFQFKISSTLSSGCNISYDNICYLLKNSYVEEDFVYDKETVAESFDNIVLDNIWAWGSVSTSDMTSGSSSLSVNYTSGEEASFSVPVPTPTSKTLAAAFDIDATAAESEFYIRSLFSVDPNYAATAEGKNVYLVDAESSKKYTVEANGNIKIPAGFKGTVIIPMDAYSCFDDTAWNSESIYAAENLRMQFRIISGLISQTEISYDNLRYLEEKESFVIETFKYDEETVAESFDNIALDNIWAWGSVSTSDMTSGSSSLSVNYTSGEEASFSVPVPTPTSKTLAVAFDIDATAAESEFYIRSLFSVDPNYAATAEGKNVYLVDAESSKKYTVEANGNIKIPAGFKGTVIIPMDAYSCFDDTAWNSESIYAAENLRMQFRIISGLISQTEISYDNLRYLEEKEADSGDTDDKDDTSSNDKDNSSGDKDESGSDDNINNTPNRISLIGKEIVSLENFSDYSGEIKDDWSGKFGCWGNNVKFSAFTAENGKLKAVYPIGDGAAWSTDIASPDKNAFAVMVDVDGSKLKSSMELKFYFSEADKYIYAATGAVYYLKDGNEGIEYKTDEDGRIIIDSGFKGTLIIPFTSYTTDAEIAWSHNDLFTTSNLEFQVRAFSVTEPNTVYFDNICYLAEKGTDNSDTDDEDSSDKDDTSFDDKDDSETQPNRILLNGKETVSLEDFSNYSGEIKDDWSGKFGCWGNNVKFSAFTVENGKLKAVYPIGDGAAWSTDIASPDKNAFAVMVDVDGSKLKSSMELKFYFSEADKYIYTSAGATYYLKDGNEGIEYKTDEDGRIIIDSGFKGTLIIPFTSYTTDSGIAWSYNDLFKASNLEFQVRAFSVTEPATVYFDNICYLAEKADEDSPADTPIDDAENENTEPERIKLGEIKTVEDFSNYSGEIKDDWSGKFGCWGNDVKFSAFTAENGGLKAVYPIGDDTAWSTDISAPGELSFAVAVDIDGSSLTSTIGLKFYFSSDSNYIYANAGATYYLKDGDEGVAYKIGEDGTITIDPDFKGTIIIPFTSYTTDDGIEWSYKDLFTASSLEFQVRAFSVTEPSVVIFDNISYVNTYGSKYTLPYNSNRVIESFDNYLDEIKEDWSGKFGCWGNDVKFSAFTAENGRLKCSYPKGDDTAWSTDIENPKKSEEAVYVTLDATKLDYDTSIRFLFSSGNAYIQTTAGKVYYMITEDGTVEKGVIGKDGNITVIAGFKGKIVVPFEAFASGEGDIEYKDIYSIEGLEFQVRMFGIKEDNTVIYFDEIGYMSMLLPQTGDSRNISPIFTVFILCLGCLLISGIYLRRKNNG